MDHDAHSPGIPLLSMQGKTYGTISDMCTVLVLAVQFNWPVRGLDKTYRVIES